MNLLRALDDPMLLGTGPFADSDPWTSWRVFLRAAYGLPLDRAERELFGQCTGRRRYDPPEGGWPEVVCIVGRQAGKTRIGAALVTFEAAFAERQTDGEVYALLLAQDQRSAIRTAFSYIRAQLEASPLLAAEVESETTDTLRLTNGVRVAAYPSRPAAVRGLRARVVVLDELAFMRNAKTGLPQDREILRAVRPTLATTGGKLIVLSSPYASSGALYDLHRRYHGGIDAGTLVWQAPAPLMHPALGEDYLARLRESDPEAARAEIDGEFLAGLSALLDPAALEAVTAHGRPLELPPAEGVEYAAFTDPSGGRADAFTLAIGHRDENGTAVVDVVRAWPAPFNPAGVVEEAAELLHRYRTLEVEGDRFAGEWPREAFRSQNIGYQTAALDRSRLYLEFLTAVMSQQCELANDEALLRELRSLERRRGSAGRDRVDHPPGGHDDRANAVAGLVHRLLDVRAGGDLGITIGDWDSTMGSGREDRDEREQRQREQDRALIAADRARRRARLGPLERSVGAGNDDLTPDDC